jgi:hypothetical protein
MTDTIETSHPADICLLLRVHAEQRWLVSNLIPTLRQLEHAGGIAEDDLGAAIAYLEVLWLEAGLRATETDAAARELDEFTDEAEVLSERARRYHAAVRRLRSAVALRVRSVITPPSELPARETAGS